MEQSSNVLKFGDWESQQDVPYTVFFEKARKRRSGDKLKPNDTQHTPPVQVPPFQKEVKVKASKDVEPTGSKNEHHTACEAGKTQRSYNSSLHHDTIGQKAAVALPQHCHVGARSGSSKPKLEGTMGSQRKYELHLSQKEVELRRPIDSPLRHGTLGHRDAAGLNFQHNGKRSMNQSIDRSPLYPHCQAMVGGKSSGVSSPSWEKRVSSEGRHGLSPSNQKSRLGSVTQDSQKPEDSTAVPRFGDWDERNPSSADGFTHIFNKVREEKQTVEGTVPSMVTEPSNPTGQKQQGKDQAKKCCCFPWGRK